MKIVKLPENKQVVQEARDLLKRCEDGEVLSFVVVEIRPEHRYIIRGSYCADRHELAGMLLDAAITRLQEAL